MLFFPQREMAPQRMVQKATIAKENLLREVLEVENRRDSSNLLFFVASPVRFSPIALTLPKTKKKVFEGRRKKAGEFYAR
jgi:hypothetical protein